MDTLKVLTGEETRKLADFMFHQIVERAGKYDLPFQIHTGILSRNYHKNPIQNTNAIHLSNLFYKYRNTKFVIFHGSFPYMDELTYLAKHYPNVYIDMCWMYIISPSASRRYLEDWLMTVPVNKILAFGGDVSVEWAYGHSVMAREAVSEVLSKMVNKGCFSSDEAVVIAQKLLRDNAIDLFKLKKNGDNWFKKL
jgi:predicted TIM-barrel fold metal-dependent hydrolase